MDLSDKEILKGVISGSQFAYKQLFLRYYTIIYRFLLKMLSDSEQAEDIAQNIFMRVWIRRYMLNPEGSIKSYLYVLAKNEALNILKKKRVIIIESEMPQVESGVAADECLLYDELAYSIEKGISELPSQRQAVFRMSREEYLTNKEIAEKMNLSVRTVEKHIELALKDLRGKIISGIVFLACVSGLF